MKKNNLIVLLCAVACLLTGLLVTACDEASGWRIVREKKEKFFSNAAGFLDRRTGITAGTVAEIHYTHDGGDTWPRAENSSMCLFGIDIVRPNLAYIVGEAGYVRVSVDGGQTWQARRELPTSRVVQLVSCIDEKTGWAGIEDALWRTENGGVTWDRLTLPEGIGPLLGMRLRTARDGYLIDASGAFYITADGGGTWRRHELKLRDAGAAFLNMLQGAAVRFTDADHGIVVINVNADVFKIVAFRTGDGGNTWAEEHVITPPSFGAVYLNNDASLLTVNVVGGKIYLLENPLPLPAATGG